MKKIASTILASGLICIALPSHAQYDPGATQMLGQGMGFNALSSSTLRNSIEATKDGKSKQSSGTKQRDRPASKPRTEAGKSGEPVLRSQADVDRYMNARMAYHARALKPEYDQRRARDGQAAADKWIRARGEELGKMEGERARKLVKRD